MATAQDLVSEVERRVRDASYAPEVILTFLNRGIVEIAGWKNTDPRLGLHGEILLPALETVATVATVIDEASVELPADYMKNLYLVGQPGGAPVSIHSSLRELMGEWYGSLANAGTVVRDVTITGDSLYYQPIPVEPLSLQLYYYRKPSALTMEDPAGITNVPSCIPDPFHVDLLVNYAVKEIYDEIEDGIDGEKLQTANYAMKYQATLNALYKSITHKSQQRLSRRREKSFF
jgi:hypothetical protein